tara:strand:+ start:108 stop:296 length:189 start_codon:yes stop_codon:yes gene_type:complete
LGAGEAVVSAFVVVGELVVEEFLFRIHGRLGSGGIPRLQRRGACSEGSELDEITAVVYGTFT